MSQPSPNLRVLLVDNDPTQLELTRLAMNNISNSFIFKIANSSAKALELIHDQHFDCIISNYFMPRMNGVDFCEMIRAEGCDTPFILFTVQDETREKERAFMVGVDAFVEKGASLEIYNVLAQRVNSLVSESRANKGL